MDEEYERWRNLIGEFMLEFAEAEVDVLDIFADFAHPSKHHGARVLPFEKRVKAARRVIKDRVADPHLQKAILEQLSELVWLAGNVRNLVAHNPMQMSLDAILKGRDEGEIRSFRDHRRVLTYPAFSKYFMRLRASRDALAKSLYKARKYLPKVEA